MANWRSYIDPSVGAGQTTLDGIINDGPTYGIQISDDLNVTGLSTFSDVARFSSTVRLDGQLRDGDNNFGTSGQVLSSDGTDTRWVSSGSLAAGAASQVAINDDGNTNASRFLTFVDSSSGNNSVKTDPQLTYNPSTNVISTAGIELDDDKEIVFGNSSDLKIFHDPSSNGGSRIEHSGHDDLRLRIGGNQMIFEKTSGENFIVMTHSTGAVEIAHNNNVKLTTTSSGVNITGIATATAFSGPLTGNVTGDVSGNAGSATILANARTIGGVSFDGSANINLPGVNQAGDQNTSGNAGTATNLANSRNFSITGEITANAVSFNGGSNVALNATVGNNIIDEANLMVSNDPVNGYFLSAQSGDTGGLTWAQVTVPSANTLSGSTLASGITASSITSLGTLSSLHVSGTTNLDSGADIDGGQVSIRYDHASSAALYVRNNTSYNQIIARFVGNSASLDIENISAGDYFFGHPTQHNGFQFFDTTGGVDIVYNNVVSVEFDSGNNFGDFKGVPSVNGVNLARVSDSITGSSGGFTAGNASNLNAGTIPAARLPNHSASLLTSGTIPAARLPNHSASLLTSGTIPAARVPTLNQNTTGSAAKLTTARNIAGTSFNGTANININYNNLTNKPSIPTNNNQLTNGRGFITATDVRSMNEASSTGQSSTTSTAFQNKVTLSINTVSNSRVLVAYSFEIKHSNTNNHSCRAQVNGTNINFVGGNLEESESDNSFQRHTGTILDIGSHSGTRTYRIQYRATSNSGQIQNAYLCVIEMSV